MKVTCCIAGGGPAGIMLGFLLARAGVNVAVLEKHADFLRDFRGDTVHPSTLEIMSELGLLDEFLQRPHQETREIYGNIGPDRLRIADFSRLKTRCRFIAFMPQWDFLDFLSAKAKRYPGFHLMMRTEATDLLEKNGCVTGLRAQTPEGPIEIEADLVIGADGRHSKIRDAAGLVAQDLGSPIDVFWMRISKRAGDPSQALGYFNFGHALVLLDRGDYWQCAMLIRKDAAEEVKKRGLESLRADILKTAPFLGARVEELKSWDDLKLLTVRIDRLKQWSKPGLLCIGDAAHAMSPVGGVGINLAIQDAVAAANILAMPLLNGTLTDDHLRAVQKRRHFPVMVIQNLQILIQNRVLVKILERKRAFRAPWILKILTRWSFLSGFPAWLIGVGVRPEHVRSPEIPRVI